MLADFDIASLMPALLGPVGVTVFALYVSWTLWRKVGECSKQIQALNEERIKGLALDLSYRQEVISTVLTAVRDAREALVKQNDMFAGMVEQLEDSDGDIEKIIGLVQEVQRGVTTLLGRRGH